MTDTTRRPVGRRLRRAVVVVVGVLVVGNVLIIGAHLLALAFGPDDDLGLDGIPRARAIDDEVWRGRAPTAQGYRSLAERGVTRIVDLRAESYVEPPSALLDELGLDLVRVPIRDGQTPTADELDRIRTAIESADGIVYVHCGAGVGRTGVVAAAYQAATTELTNRTLLWQNLSIGPPSLEQIVYAATAGDDPEQPPAWVKVVSRFFDGPRRLWHNLRGDV